MNQKTLESDGPFVVSRAAEPTRTRVVPEPEGPFELPAAGETPRAATALAPRERYAVWSDADDRAKGRRPRDQAIPGHRFAAANVSAAKVAAPNVLAANVLVFPPAAGRNERIFVLQNFKIDGAALRPEHRAYLADVAGSMKSGKWQVFAEAHASRTGAQRHDDDLSEDRYLVSRATLASALQSAGVDLTDVRISGKGVGFRHSPMPGEDPRARSVYIVVQPDPSLYPPPAWPPPGVPTIWPPKPPVIAALDPPRWGPILGARISPNAALRTGNAVRHLIEGPDTFRAMVQAIRTAQSPEHYIYLLAWQLVDDFELISGDPTTTFQALMASASARGVQIRAMLWAKPADNFVQTRRIDKLPTGGAIRDNLTEHPIFGAHHQKVLVVKGAEGLIGFCGGLDINKDRVAVVGGTMGEPLHDVHVRISGPASWDLLQTFIRRWDHHPDHIAIDRKKGPLLGRSEPVPAPVPVTTAGQTSSVPHTCSVAIARTFNPVTRGIVMPRERDIQTLFLESIAQARRFIYIEDQYLVNLQAASALRGAVPRLAHLTILIPGSEATDMPCRWKFRRDFINTLTAGLSAGDLAKVRIFQRVSVPITKPPTFGFHTYIHAKTWMFDDELAVIGSANVNRRGWEHDSEVDAFNFDDVAPESSAVLTLAQKLRIDLWAEHLGMPASAFLDGVASVVNWWTLPPTAHVIPYDPLAGTDNIKGIPVPDRVCDGMRDKIDPGLPVGGRTAAKVATEAELAPVLRRTAAEVTCTFPPASIISGYAEYADQMSADQSALITRIAQQIVDSFAGDMPIVAVGVVGHADTALRKPPRERAKFEGDVSVHRAVAATRDLRSEVERLGQGKDPEPIKIVKFAEPVGMGSTKKLVSHPRTESQMKLNRRVEVFFGECKVPPQWTWIDSAQRGMAIVKADTDAHKRIRCMLDLILRLKENARDGYLEYKTYKDLFFPPGFTEAQKEKLLRDSVTHLEKQLESGRPFRSAVEIPDGDFIAGLESIDEVITRSMRDFQRNAEISGAGALIVRAWKLIQLSRTDPNSIYSCYASYRW